MTIDMRKYGGEYYLTIADVRDGPLRMKIVDVREGKYDKPDLIFETGDALSSNETNRRVLMRAYGPTSDTWISKDIEPGPGRNRVSRQAAGVSAYQTGLAATHRCRAGCCA